MRALNSTGGLPNGMVSFTEECLYFAWRLLHSRHVTEFRVIKIIIKANSKEVKENIRMSNKLVKKNFNEIIFKLQK